MTLQSTLATLQNSRKQRELQVELTELDRKWHVELKGIARERLGVLKDLCKYNQDQRLLDHFQHNIHGKDLTRFADRAQNRLQHTKELKLLHKYDFQPDPVEKMNLQLPFHREKGEAEGAGDDVAKVLTAKELNKHRVQLQKTNFEQCVADRRNRRRPFWDKALLNPKKKKKSKNPFEDQKCFFDHRTKRFDHTTTLDDDTLEAERKQEGSLKPRALNKDCNGFSTYRAGIFGRNRHPVQDSLRQEAGREDSAKRRGLPKELNGLPRQRAGKKAENSVAEYLRKLESSNPRELTKSPSLPALNIVPKVLETKSQPPVHASLSKRYSASLDYLPVTRGTREQDEPTSLQETFQSSYAKLPPIVET